MAGWFYSAARRPPRTLELLVLRHEVTVLRRTQPKPRWDWAAGQPGQGCEDHPILRFQGRAVDLSSQHSNLVSQDEELDVLRGVPAYPEQHQAESVACQGVEQRPHHDRPACPTWAQPRRQTRRSPPKSGFWSPTGLLTPRLSGFSIYLRSAGIRQRCRRGGRPDRRRATCGVPELGHRW
ncbi:hypothetical protein FMEAI12_7050026 [Parafrankia sp. Ea1.12]|nr:hypothetical protein FMEAI12_7050026 [Parafrankia sp. Ea1.12]